MKVAADHLAEPLSDGWNRLMEPLSQLQLDSNEPEFEPLSRRFAESHNLPLEISPTNVGEAQEVKCLWLSQPTSCPIRGRITAKFEEARFLRVQLQEEPGETFAQLSFEEFCIPTVLETYDEIVGPADDDDISLCSALPPGLNPQV